MTEAQRNSMIGEMVYDYSNELQRLKDDELTAQYNFMRHVKEMSDDEWRTVARATTNA